MIKEYFLPPRLAKMQVTNTYIQRLREDVSYYWYYITNKLSETTTCEDIYTLLTGDEKITGCKNQSALKACGFEAIIESDIPEIQYLLNLQTTNIKEYLHSRKSLLENTILFGTGIMRKKYTQLLDYKTNMTWTLVKSMDEVSIRRLRLERKEIRQEPYWTLWHPCYDRFIILEDRACVPNVIEGCALQDYIWMMYSHEEAQAYFTGFGHVLYKLVYIKNELLKNWAELAGFWSKPFILPKFDMNSLNMNATMDGISTLENALSAAKDAFNQRKISDNIIVCDTKEDIVIKEMGAMGNNIIEGFINWINKAITMLFYGASLTTDNEGKGGQSYALGEVHERETEKGVKYNNARLTEALKYQLYLDVIYRNQKQLMQQGIDVNRISINDFTLRLV